MTVTGPSLCACWPYCLFSYSAWVFLGVQRYGDVRGNKHAETELEKHRSLLTYGGGDNRVPFCGFHIDLDVQPWR